MKEDRFSELDKTILPWLGRTMKAMDYFVKDHFSSRGLKLTKAQMIVLKVLSRRNGIAQNNLAFITNRDKTSLTRLIETMEKNGLVNRLSDTEDKRIKRVSITEEGKKTIDSAVPIIYEILEKVQDGIKQEDLETTIRVLKQIGKNINADELTTPLNQ